MSNAVSADASSRPVRRLLRPGWAQHRAVGTAAQWLKAACLAMAWAPFQALAAAPDPAAFNGFDVANASIPTSAIQRGGPPRDGIPAIDQPKFVSAAAAGLADDDRVLGLALGGIVRAYPVRILNWHEVVNDRFGQRAVVVTYCPLCGTGMAFDAKLAGTGDVMFGVSGLLYNSDVLLYDRASQSLWSQISRTAVSGPLKGAKLQALPLTHTRWADWRGRHPGTQVMSTDTGHARNYGHDPYAGYGQVQRLMFEVQHRDERLPLKEWVLGVEVGSVHKAYPFSVLDKRVNNRGELIDTVAGQKLTIRYQREHGSAEAFDAKGQPVAATMAYWFAWVAFHPQTELLGPR